MKRLLTLIIALAFATMATAQVEFTYDFNNLNTGSQNLNGQDGWKTHYQNASSSQDFDVDYVCGSIMAPDESIAVWYPYGGSGVGRTATRKASPNFNSSFTFPSRSLEISAHEPLGTLRFLSSPMAATMRSG